VFGVRTLRLSH